MASNWLDRPVEGIGDQAVSGMHIADAAADIAVAATEEDIAGSRSSQCSR